VPESSIDDQVESERELVFPGHRKAVGYGDGGGT
jgi:hypothetical protein